MDRNKRNGRKSKNAPPPPQSDDHHNLHTPTCNLVVQVSNDVFLDSIDKLNVNKEVPPQSLLGSLVREYLLEKRRKDAGTSKRKTRKKRKKKKGKAPAADEGTSETPAANSAVTPQDDGPSEMAQSEAAAEQSPPEIPAASTQPPLADLASKTSPVVLQWLDQQEPKPLTINRSLTAFCESLSKQSKKPPSIKMSEISKALDAVSCIACRAAVEGFWQSTGIPMGELDLDSTGGHHQDRVILEPRMIEIPSNGGLSVPLANDEWGDVERAFDYQAMEEGMALPATTPPADKRKPDPIVTFEPVVDKNGKIQSMQVTSELDTVAVERLLRQVLLPCGLEELEHPNAFPITDEQFGNITQHVTGQERRIHQQLHELRDKKTTVQNSFHATAVNPSQAGSFDVKSATALRDCDQECDDLLSSLLSMLLQVTTLTDGLPSAEWAHTRTKRLWDSYELGVQRIVDQSLQHESKLLQLANRPGVVPQMFLNVAHRSSFRDLVSEKFHVLGEFFLELFTTLTDDEENPQGPIFLRRLMSYPPFTNATIGEPFQRTELDTVIARLVESFSKLMHSVRSGRVSEIHDAQDIKINKVSELLRESSSVIEKEYQRVRPTLEQIDQSEWKALQQDGKELLAAYMSSHTEDSSPESSREESFSAETDGLQSEELAELRRDLVCLVINMISQWRCLRWMRSQTVEAPIMPLRLIRWLHDRELGDSSTTPQVCHGRGGQRRLAGVLASMLYQWLVDSCNEWHAELTQSELLEAMEMSDAPSKSSKKKKKKKGAAAVKKVPAVVSDDVESFDSSEKVDDDKKPATSKAPPNGVSVGAKPPLALNGDLYEPGVEEQKEEYIPGVEETKEEPPPLVEKLNKSRPEEKKSKPDVEMKVKHQAKGPNTRTKHFEGDKKRPVTSQAPSVETTAAVAIEQAKGSPKKGTRAPAKSPNGHANGNGEQKSKVASLDNSAAPNQDQPKTAENKKKQSRSNGKENGSSEAKKSSKKTPAAQKTEPEPTTTTLVGVKDASGKVQPAEDFLVARLLAILKDGAKDTRGKPIVIL